VFRAIASALADKLRGDVLLRNKDFRLFWLSTTLNGFGGQVSSMAIPLCAALLLNASPLQMGLLAAMQSLPFALFALPAGVMLDRSRKKPVLLSSKSIAALALVSIAIAHGLGVLSIPWLYCVAFLLGTNFVFGGSAEQIFLTSVVGRSGLIAAHSRFAASDSAARLIGPGVAGALVQLMSAPLTVLVTAATLAASIATMRTIMAADPLPEPSDSHPVRDMLNGLAFIWGHPLLLPFAWGVGVWQMLFAAYTSMGILFATRELGLSPSILGIVHAMGGLGLLASAVLMQRMIRRHGRGPTMLIGLVATVACFILTAALPARLFGSAWASVIAYGALLFLLDFGMMLFILPYIALRQEVTPDHFMGRIVSTMRFLTVASAPLGALASGMVAEQFGIRASLIGVAAAACLLTVFMFAASPLRGLKAVAIA